MARTLRVWMVWLEMIPSILTGSCWCTPQMAKLEDLMLVLGVTFRMQMRRSSWILQRGEDSPTTVGQHEAKGGTSAPTSILIKHPLGLSEKEGNIYLSISIYHPSCFWLWQRTCCFRCMFWLLIEFHFDVSFHQLCRSLSIWAKTKASCISEFSLLTVHQLKTNKQTKNASEFRDAFLMAA